METENISFKPVTSGGFGKVLDKDYKSYQDFLVRQGKQLQKEQTALGENQTDLIIDRDAGIKADYTKYKKDIDAAKLAQEERIAGQRSKAQSILKEQEAGAGLESQIQAAKAGQSGKMTLSSLAKISGDIASTFGASLTEARNNLNAFEQGLDKELSALDFDTIDKQKMITALENIMNHEEVQPALDSLLKNASTQEEFLKIFSKFYSEQKEKQITDLSGKALEENKFLVEVAAFKEMKGDKKRTYIIGKTKYLLDLTPEQRTDFVEKAMNSSDPATVLADIDRMKKLNDQQIIALQTAIDNGTGGEEIFTLLHNMLGTGTGDGFSSQGSGANIIGSSNDTYNKLDSMLKGSGLFNGFDTPEDYAKNILNNIYKNKKDTGLTDDAKNKIKDHYTNKTSDGTGSMLTDDITGGTIIPVTEKSYKDFAVDVKANYTTTTDTIKADKIKPLYEKFEETYGDLRTTDKNKYETIAKKFVEGLIREGYLVTK